jgi:hypothetical protein
MRILGVAAARSPSDHHAQTLWADAQGATLGTFVGCSHFKRMRHFAALSSFARGSNSLIGVEGPFLSLLHGADLAGDSYWSAEGRAVWKELAREPCGLRSHRPSVVFIDLGTGLIIALDPRHLENFALGRELPFGSGLDGSLRPELAPGGLFIGGLGALFSEGAPFGQGGSLDLWAGFTGGLPTKGADVFGGVLGQIAPGRGIGSRGPKGGPGGALGDLLGLGDEDFGSDLIAGFVNRHGPTGGGIAGQLGSFGNTPDSSDHETARTIGKVVGGVVGGVAGAYLLGGLGSGWTKAVFGGIGGTILGYEAMGLGGDIGAKVGEWISPTAPSPTGDDGTFYLPEDTPFNNSSNTEALLFIHKKDGSDVMIVLEPGAQLPASPAPPPQPDPVPDPVTPPEPDDPEPNPVPDPTKLPDGSDGEPRPDTLPDSEGGQGGPRWRDFRATALLPDENGNFHPKPNLARLPDDLDAEGHPRPNLLQRGAFAFTIPIASPLLEVQVTPTGNALRVRLGQFA